MFVTELMLDTNALTFQPSEENFQVCFQNWYELVHVRFHRFSTNLQYFPCEFLQETIAEIVGLFEKTVLSVNTLTADPDFGSRTEPKTDKVDTNKFTTSTWQACCV